MTDTLQTLGARWTAGFRPSGSDHPGGEDCSSSVTTRVVVGCVADTEESISAELRDAVTDAVITASSRAGRADVICGLVGEAFGSADWLGARDNADDEELASLSALVAAAHEHHARMAATQPVQTGATANQ